MMLDLPGSFWVWARELCLVRPKNGNIDPGKAKNLKRGEFIENKGSELLSRRRSQMGVPSD